MKKTRILSYFSLITLVALIQACKPVAQVEPEVTNLLSLSEKKQITTEMDARVESLLSELGDHQDSDEYVEAVISSNNASGVSSFALSGGGLASLPRRIKKGLLEAWNRAGRSTCRVLKPYVDGFEKNGGRRPYFFVGTSVDGGAFVKGVTGVDFVWDLYNMQFSSFRYSGLETTIGAGAIAAGASAYVGVGFGNKASVDDAWSGQFMGGTVSGSLPILADYFSIGAMGFTSSVNLQPDYSIIGAGIVLQVGFSVPTAAPVGATGQVASWHSDRALNRKIASNWRKMGIPLSTTGRDTCNGNCVRIDTNQKKASYAGRATTLLRSIPMLAVPGGGNLVFPGYNNIALLAYATGVYRDIRNSAQACDFK
ncbi:hypothetical protein N9W79_02115 [bacterium]|nr:hypothetical protein [bacterium]